LKVVGYIFLYNMAMVDGTQKKRVDSITDSLPIGYIHIYTTLLYHLPVPNFSEKASRLLIVRVHTMAMMR